jgi:hypothetical protein
MDKTIKTADFLRLAILSLYCENKLPLAIRGTRAELKALSEALMATRLFEQEANNDGNTVSTVMEALNRKHRAAARFQKIFGQNWPL